MNWCILSLDLSAASTGWCIMAERYADYGIIKTNNKNNRSERLNIFRKELVEVIRKNKPTHIVVEDIYSGLNAKTLKILAEFAGVAKEVCQEYLSIDPYVMSNNTTKAYFKVKTKEDLFNFLVDILDFKSDWNFKKDNDIIDAIAMAMCYLDTVLGLRSFRKTTEYGFIYLNNW